MSDLPTVQRLRSWPRVRVVEVLAGLGLRAGLSFGVLDVDGIVDAARRRTGLSELGDEGFLEPMRRLFAEAVPSAITPLARLMMRQGAVSAVANRLRIQDYVRRYPDVLDVPVERPIFVLGFPRTGTTLLQDLLALSPECRELRFWELLCPAPVHADPDTDQSRRRLSARAVVAAAYFVAPEQRVIHQLGVDTPEECWLLFQNRFSALNNDLASGFTGFGEWLLTQELRPAYEDYRRQLQVLLHQRKGPGRLVLKCPEHLWFLDPLLQVFPDARIVWTHRDPVDSVASYCSLSSLQIRNMWGVVDARRVGENISHRFAQGVERAMAARDRHPGARFVDVRFDELAADPRAVFERVREAVEIPASPALEAAVTAHLASGRGEGVGKHVYRAEPWGIDAAALRPRFAAYIERFQVPAGRFCSGSGRARLASSG